MRVVLSLHSILYIKYSKPIGNELKYSPNTLALIFNNLLGLVQSLHYSHYFMSPFLTFEVNDKC